MSGPETRLLLENWHRGDKAALGRLIERNLEWIRGRVHNRMGALLEAKGTPTDYVQDAVVEVLRYGPKFVMSDEAQFRALMVKIVENVLRGRHDWFTAQRRDAARDAPAGDTIIDFDALKTQATRASVAIDRQEAAELTRLGISLLDDEDREIIVLRQWEGLSFAELADRLNMPSEDAARMRFQRVIPRLAEKVELLCRGDVGTLLEET